MHPRLRHVRDQRAPLGDAQLQWGLAVKLDKPTLRGTESGTPGSFHRSQKRTVGRI